MNRSTDTPLTRLELLLGDFARACVGAAVIVGGSFLAGVVNVIIHRGGL